MDQVEIEDRLIRLLKREREEEGVIFRIVGMDGIEILDRGRGLRMILNSVGIGIELYNRGERLEISYEELSNRFREEVREVFGIGIMERERIEEVGRFIELIT
jgi:hypothetical protein